MFVVLSQDQDSESFQPLLGLRYDLFSSPSDPSPATYKATSDVLEILFLRISEQEKKLPSTEFQSWFQNYLRFLRVQRVFVGINQSLYLIQENSEQWRVYSHAEDLLGETPLTLFSEIVNFTSQEQIFEWLRLLYRGSPLGGLSYISTNTRALIELFSREVASKIIQEFFRFSESDHQVGSEFFMKRYLLRDYDYGDDFAMERKGELLRIYFSGSRRFHFDIVLSQIKASLLNASLLQRNLRYAFLLLQEVPLNEQHKISTVHGSYYSGKISDGRTDPPTVWVYQKETGIFKKESQDTPQLPSSPVLDFKNPCETAV